jgi:hypothetical protein
VCTCLRWSLHEHFISLAPHSVQRFKIQQQQQQQTGFGTTFCCHSQANKTWDTYTVRPRRGTMILLVASNWALFSYPLYLRKDTQQVFSSFSKTVMLKIPKNNGAKCDASSPERYKTAQCCINDIAKNVSCPVTFCAVKNCGFRCIRNHSRTQTIRTLVIRIGLALRVNLSRILQN